jgi:hypothetical protein
MKCSAVSGAAIVAPTGKTAQNEAPAAKQPGFWSRFFGRGNDAERAE